ncbi:hypothetical protein LTR17_006077 [Elasticomyces elasticus]|nr:hypothetical protein LTR17_006077 [Elasticomyces elasticus]
MTAVTENNNKVFGLLDLPPELWLKIAKYVLDNTPKVKSWPSNYAVRLRPQDCAPLRQPAITRTCHALRIELLPLFYEGHIRFRFYDGHNGGCARGSTRSEWLSAIGATNRRCLKNVELLANTYQLRHDLRTFTTRFHFDVELGTPVKDTYGEEEMERACGIEEVYPLIFK